MKQRKKQPVVTRRTILDAAGLEFSHHGYAGTGLGLIVARAELTKGALFHHFPDKRTLAAVWIGENLSTAMETLWVAPLQSIHSLDEFRSHCRSRCLELQPADATSALVSLTAETSADPILSEALKGVFARWLAATSSLLERGKSEGWIHRSIHPAVEAAFLVSTFSGFTVTTKCDLDGNSRRTCATAIEGYLETLRAQ